MLARYYQEELDYLRGMAREFADSHPGVIADALLTPGSDPDVERLLEGFAFLAGRVRQRIEDDFPEIVHTIIGLLWPQFLRPIPSACIVAFTPQPGRLREVRHVPAGAEIESVAGPHGTRCRFRTCWDLDLLPMTVSGARLEAAAGKAPAIHISFRLEKDIAFDAVAARRADADADAGPDADADASADAKTARLRLFLHEGPTALALADVLSRNLAGVKVKAVGEGANPIVIDLGAEAVRFPGLDPGKGLLPDPPRAFSGFRVLQDYFVLPEKYQFVDVLRLERARGTGIPNEFDLVFELRAWPENLQKVEAGNFRLGCVPVLNLFEHDARPWRIERERSEYVVIPDVDDPQQMETFAVLDVAGIVPGSGEEREFAPLYSLSRRPEPDEASSVYYRTRLRPSIDGKSTETWLGFIDVGEAFAIPPVETIRVRLLCSNGRLPTELAPGDLRERCSGTPADVTFRDITRIMPPVPPALEGRMSWRLVSLIALNYLSLADTDNLRTLLRLTDARSAHDKAAQRRLDLRLEAIDSVRVSDDDEWLVRGRPVRGRAIEIKIRDQRFGGAPEVQLFGSVLDVLFAMCSSVNSHTRLTIRGIDSGEEFRWRPRHGAQILQ